VRVPGLPAILRERDYRLVFASGVVSLVGDGVVTVALAFAVLDLTGSASDLGLVLAARTVALLGGLIAGGVVADRLSRRDVMIAADAVRFVAQGVLAVLLLSGGAELWLVALLQVPLGAASGFFNPALSGLLPTVVAPQHLQQANALRGIATAAGGVLGPALAALLIAAAGPGEALLLDALTYAASAALLVGIRRDAGGRGPRASFVGDLRGGWHEVRSRPWVGMVIAGASFAVMLSASANVLGPAVADEHFGGATGWSVVRGAGAVGGVLGGLLALRMRPRRPLVAAIVAVGLFGLPQLALAGPAPLAVVAAVSVLGTGGLMVFNAVWETTLQQHVPPHALARVSSYDWFGSLAFQPLGMALAGPVAVALGTEATLLGAGILEVAVSVLLLCSPAIRGVRARPSAAGERAPTP
jgi:predicted MFS family arabinose efflux permease